jgi:peptidoglycan hydrolase CwlO-like protein
MDKNVCKTQHQQIGKDLEKGDKKFETLITKREKATEEMASINKNLGLLNRRLDILNPFIEKAAGMVMDGKKG